ncbi:MAG: ABC transporter substrate-binding protein [Chloroflexota bacterium]
MKHHHKLHRFSIILILTTITITLLACNTVSEPQQLTIGIATSAGPLGPPVIAGFKEGMAEFGYVEGETITYLIPDVTEDSQEAYLPVVQTLLDANVDLILAIGTPVATVAAPMVEGTDVPVVFAPAVNPVEAGLVDNMRQPGGNLTGIKAGGFFPKELEWLTQIAPDVRVVWLPNHGSDGGSVATVTEAQQIASSLGVELLIADVESGEEMVAALEAIPDEVDAILVAPAALLAGQLSNIIAAGEARDLPVVFHHHHRLEEGLLLSFGPSIGLIGKQASQTVDQILKGAKPGDLPVDTAEFLLGINLKRAEALGLTVPEAVVRQANTIVR